MQHHLDQAPVRSTQDLTGREIQRWTRYRSMLISRSSHLLQTTLQACTLKWHWQGKKINDIKKVSEAPRSLLFWRMQNPKRWRGSGEPSNRGKQHNVGKKWTWPVLTTVFISSKQMGQARFGKFKSLSAHNHTKLVSLSQLSRWGIWNAKDLINLPKVAQRGRGRAEIQMQVVLL